MTAGRYSEQDHEHYERPRRRTRPRTKERPTYDDAVDGVVVTVDRGRYTLLVEGRTVTAMKSRPLGRKGVVVGDRVRVVGDISGDDGSLARIVEVNERTTMLRRTADDDDPVERVIVANADQLVVVTALADPEPQHRPDRPRPRGGVRRRHDAAAVPDQGRPRRPRDPARDLPLPRRRAAWSPSAAATWTPCAPCSPDAPACWSGHSGVGKSTLVNALVPEAHREVGIVNAVTGRGRHTSTSAYMLPLPGDDGGWIIDTPGIRSFGLAHVDPDRLIEAFPDLDGRDRGLPARLHARRGRARVRARRGGRRRARRRRRGWSRSGGCSRPGARRVLATRRR